MTLGGKIKKLRQETGMTQQQLADAICVSRAAIARWENENGIPDIVNIKSLASFFLIDINALLNEEVDIATCKRIISINMQEFVSVESLLVKQFPEAYKISPVILLYDFNKAERVINTLTFGLLKCIWQISHRKECTTKYFYIDTFECPYLAEIAQKGVIIQRLSYRPENLMHEFYVGNKKFLDLNQNVIKKV